MNQLAAVSIGTTFNSPWGNTLGFADFVSVILSNSVAIAAVILFFIILGAGVAMIHGANNSDPKATAAGKQALTAAILGFILIFTAYWIIQIIEAVTSISILSARF